ncbi:CPBP family intramembrane glutamic endopeptidase [Streptococcus dentasini]
MTKDTKTIEPQPNLIPSFLAWTFGWSWGLWGLTIILNTLSSGRSVSLAMLTIILGSFGPALGTKMAMKLSLRELWGYIFSSRRRTWLPLLLLMSMEAIVYALASPGLNPERSLWTAPISFLFILICGGGNEEIGWRGFLQPALEKRFRFWQSAVLIGLVWTLWHVPLWFIPGSSQAGTSFLIFALEVLVLSFVFSGLYKHSKSVWYCALLHAFNNLLSGPFIKEGFNYMIYFAGIGLMALYASWLWYRTDKEEKAYD